MYLNLSLGLGPNLLGPLSFPARVARSRPSRALASASFPQPLDLCSTVRWRHAVGTVRMSQAAWTVRSKSDDPIARTLASRFVRALAPADSWVRLVRSVSHLPLSSPTSPSPPRFEFQTRSPPVLPGSPRACARRPRQPPPPPRPHPRLHVRCAHDPATAAHDLHVAPPPRARPGPIKGTLGTASTSATSIPNPHRLRRPSAAAFEALGFSAAAVAFSDCAAAGDALPPWSTPPGPPS